MPPAMPGRGATRGGRLAVALLALLTYGALSAALFGRQALGDLHHVFVGFGQSPRFYGHDQGAYTWSLAWLAHALGHGQNPLLTHAIFAPVGYNLVWAASVFGPGLLVLPATLALGAVATYDLLVLSAPAVAAWTAFLLCRQLGARTAAALAGGLLFGFGTYESVEMVNHLNLALVALVPLAALLVVRRHAGELSRRGFVLALGALLALQLWTSSEVFATLVMFGALAFLIGALVAGPRRRPPVWACAREALGALALALVLAAPYLYYALRYPNPVSGLVNVNAGADLVNLVLPSKVTWLHATGGLGAAAKQLAGNLTEQLGYFGIPLILLLGACAIEGRRSRLGRFLMAFGAIAVVASLGGELYVDGNATGVPLPWAAVGWLPLLRFAAPVRLVMYAWLALAVAVSCWLGRPGHARARWLAFALVAVSLAPNMTGIRWGTRVDAPRLLATPALARYVPAGSTVLALPLGIGGDSMSWQVEADFRFRLAGGYVSVAMPTAYARYFTLVRDLEWGRTRGRFRRRLCEFIRFTGSEVILLREHTPGYWAQLLGPLGVRPADVGGFTIYELSGGGGACAVARPDPRQRGRLVAAGSWTARAEPVSSASAGRRRAICATVPAWVSAQSTPRARSAGWN
jgi:hypothetical protein